MAKLNHGFEYRERLGPAAAGRRLLDYLARRYAHSTADQWSERIESGLVRLDSSPCRPDAVLRHGQLLVWRRPPWIEPHAPRDYTILFEDDELLAVNKPAGLPTLPGGGFLESTLLRRVRRYAPNASPVHRLGRWTSGAVLFARSRRTRAELAARWVTRSVVKRYRALAEGRPGWRERVVNAPIGPVPHDLLGTVNAVSAEGKPATSHVRVAQRCESEDAFLCDVRIATGRPHQIRIHLAAIGHPLVGDRLYCAGGVPAAGCRALPGDPGYRLHAAELSFPHPRTGDRITIASPPPPSLRVGG